MIVFFVDIWYVAVVLVSGCSFVFAWRFGCCLQDSVGLDAVSLFYTTLLEMLVS